MTTPWYEVWVDDGLPVPYPLIVLPNESGRPGAVVVDPKDSKIVYRADDYESAKMWLLEDEYKLVDGRMEPG